MPGELLQTAVELSPEEQARRERGIEILTELGILDSAGIVMECPDPKGAGATGTMADMMGMENPTIIRNVTESIADARADGEDLNRAVERDFKMFIQRDEKRQVVRVELPEIAQKKT